MSPVNRRQFVRQAALTAAAFYGCRKAFNQVLPDKADGPGAGALDPAVIRKLASELSGRVIDTKATDYDTTRLVFNRAFDQHPALIVRCSSESDVARALEFAQRQNLPLAVRAGGHSRAGFGVCDGGLVIDVSGMKHVEVDHDKRVARAAAGALVGDLDRATQPYDLATTSGGCPTVGLAGFTTGGGEGLLMQTYGAACDNLVSARVVTVDGRQLEASQQSNPDLFWAIRGGGGNFGVVTSFEYRLHSIGKVFAGALTYPAGGRIPELLQSFAKFSEGAPDEMVPLGEILPTQDGPTFINHLCYLGEPQAGNDLLKPLRALKPKNDNLRVMSYFQAQAGGFTPPPAAHFQTDLILPQLNGSAVASIAAAINDAPPLCRVLIVPFFGAITRVAVVETAFALRQTGYEVDMQCRWNHPAEKANAVKWVKGLRDSLQPFARGVYVNQTSETSADLVRQAYGANYARLVEIKRKYDPNNVLRLNQNIKPN